jgi:hypothetical protein
MTFSPPMTQEQIKYAIAQMREIIEAKTLEDAHVRTMLPKMEAMAEHNDYATREKLMRWIGFMQGALWSLGYYTIDELREMNTKEL